MDDSLSPLEALRACAKCAGSVRRLAIDLKVPQQTMWRWINEKGRLPGEYVLQAERRYGVSRHDLRPDLYPIEGMRA